jgi:hypothetical protein
VERLAGALELGTIIGTEMRALWLAGATEFDPWSGLPRMGLDGAWRGVSLGGRQRGDNQL